MESKRQEDLNGRLQVAIYSSKILIGERDKEMGQDFGIKGQGVSDAIKRIEGKLDEDSQLRLIPPSHPY